MRTLLRIYFRIDGARPWTVLFCLLSASIVEGVGFISLVPLLSVLTTGDGTDQSYLTMAAQDIAKRFDMSFEVGPLLSIFVGAMVVKSVLVFFADRHVGYTIAEVVTRLRRRIIEDLLNARWGYFVRHPVGKVMHLLSGEASRVGQGYKLAATFIADTIRTVTYLIVAFFVSWPVTVGAIGVGCVMAISLHFLVGIARKAGQRQTQRMTELIAFLVDALNSIKPLKAMAKQDAFARLFDKKITSLRKALRRQVISRGALRKLNDIMLAICLGIGFYLAITTWNVQFVDLVVVGVLLTKSVRGVTKIQEYYQRAAVIETPCLKIERVLKETAAEREQDHGHQTATLNKGCRLQDVTFSYGEKKVLDSVSLEIPAGQVTVLTGPSGAGKTTIADLIIGLYAPDVGQLTVDGVPLREIKLKSWRRQIGYVPQELILFNDSAHANVSLGDPNVGEAEVRMALELAGAWGFVKELPEGVMTNVGEKGAKLSGGQRQRIAVARGVVSRPKLLILDEASSSLDPDSEREICKNIAALAEEGEMTVLAITHRPAFLDIAHRVYRVEDGRVEPVTHNDLMAVAGLA